MSTDESNTDENNAATTARLSTARSRELGEELRRIRHRAKLSSSCVAESMGWSLGKLSKLETGTRGTTPWEIGTLVGRLGADKLTRERILAIASDPDTGSFLRPHDGIPDTLLVLTLHESEARTITAYEPLTIPSLAQTEEYTHALTGDQAVTDARMNRQDVLRNRSVGPDTVLYVHEAAIRTLVGTPVVMRDQLLRLTLMCQWERYTLRVIPMGTPSHAALGSPATLLTFDPPTKALVYTETDAATVFHDDADAVTRYQAKMRWLSSLALSPKTSHDFFARWADAYDRQSH